MAVPTDLSERHGSMQLANSYLAGIMQVADDGLGSIACSSAYAAASDFASVIAKCAYIASAPQHQLKRER